MRFRALYAAIHAVLASAMLTACPSLHTDRDASDDRSVPGDHVTTVDADSEADVDPLSCDPTIPSDCVAGQVCEAIATGSTRCFAPIEVHGDVRDALTAMPIGGARVVAIAADGHAASDEVFTDSLGQFALDARTTRTRSGVPVAVQFTLRVEATGYQAYPVGIRTADAIATPTTVDSSGGATIMPAAAHVTLFARTPTMMMTTTGTVPGRVSATDLSGVLIVCGTQTSITDRQGRFELYDVRSGMATVVGLAAGVQLGSSTVLVPSNARASEVDLASASTPLGTVSGSVSIVNGGSATGANVVLMARGTFSDPTTLGEVPRGLALHGITDAFQFTNVPSGEYFVVAGYGADGLVLDPSPAASGTRLPSVTLGPAAPSATIAAPIPLTAALHVRSPGAVSPTAVTTASPTFSWDDDSGEDGYELRVITALGSSVFSNVMIPSGSGPGAVSTTYAGSALVPGMWYRFSVTSYRLSGTTRQSLRTTEPALGVFYPASM